MKGHRMKRLKFLATCHRRTGFLLFLGALATQLHAASGDADLSLDAGSGVNDEVTRMALQPDGKLIVAGSFTTVSGLSRGNLARLNPDGSGDATFDAGTNADRFISAHRSSI